MKSVVLRFVGVVFASLTEVDLKKARALLRSGDYTKVQVAEDFR